MNWKIVGLSLFEQVKRWLLLITISFGWAFCVLGQSYEFRHLSVEDGLSQSAIYSALQDSDGYMWFGTYDGLNRYDGTDFEIFRHVRGDSTSLSNNQVLSLTECPKNQLWIGTTAGVNLYNRDLKTFKQFRVPSDDRFSNIINVLQPLCDSLLFVGTDNGGYTFSLEQGIFNAQLLPGLETSLRNRTILSTVIQDQELWICTNQELFIYDLEQRSLLHEKMNRVDVKTPKSVLIDEEGFIWLMEPDRALRVNADGETVFERHIPVEKRTNRIPIAEFEEKIWFSLDGLKVIDKNDYELTDVWHQEDDPNSISSDLVSVITPTADGIVWVGTSGLGMNQYDPKAPRLHQIGYQNNLRPRFTKSIHTWDDERIFSSTNRRIEYFELSTREFTTIRTAEERALDNSDFFLEIDQYLLAGGKRELYLIDAQGKAVSFDAPGRVWTAVKYDNKVLLGIRGGIFSISTDQLLRKGVPNSQLLMSDYQKVADFPSGKINQLIQFQDETWVITSLGLWVLQGNELRKFEEVYSGFSAPELTQELRSLLIASDGTIWLATVTNGILALDLQEKSIRQFDERQGLSNGNVYGILEDGDGDLWISTNYGLSKFQVKQESFLNYTNIEGLQSKEFNSGSFFKSLSGMMYFGGVNGMNYFDPKAITANRPPSNTRIISFSLNHEEIVAGRSSMLTRSIDKTDSIYLNYEQNSFEFQFAHVNFRDARSIRYQYRLKGFDVDWIDAGDRRSASYTNMEPGDYVFEVRAVNHTNSLPQEGHASLSILISEPFWRSVPFRIMMGALVVILLLSWVVYLRYRNQVLEKLVDERTSKIEEQKRLLLDQNRELSRSLKELKNTQTMLLHSEKMASLGTLVAGLGHEINNPLNFIKGGLSLLNRKVDKGDKEIESFIGMVEAGVRRISRLLKSLQKLGISRLGEKKACSVHRLVDNSLDFFETSFDGRVTVTKDFQEKDLFVTGYEGELQQAIYQVMANADQSIKGEGAIDIRVFAENGFANIEIVDSGIGIDHKDSKRVWDPFYTTRDPGKGEGLGLPIAYSVIRDHKGGISLSSKKGEGTLVSIKLPLTEAGLEQVCD